MDATGVPTNRDSQNGKQQKKREKERNAPHIKYNDEGKVLIRKKGYFLFFFSTAAGGKNGFRRREKKLGF
jgi:hypothetical protein